jgi:hypothetical protein
MKRVLKVSLSAVAGLGFLMLAAPSQAGQAGTFDFVSSSAAISMNSVYSVRNPRLIQVASHMNSQTANVPVGTIRLRVIPEVGARAMREPIRWRVMTYGKDVNGKRHQVAEVTGATPEISLPAGWYVVHAQLRDKTIKHPVEVTAGKTFKYTLVKQ